MSNDDKRRRRDGSTVQLSVADLLARREAETQPIPRITDDEETVRFSAVKSAEAGHSGPIATDANLSGRELHITELLRREGRAGEEERGGGFSVPKLVAMAGGGVVLAGTVAFTASNLLSSPDERPLAEVRFDARPAARATNTLTKDLGAAAAKQQEAQPQAQSQTQGLPHDETTATTTPRQTAEQRARQTAQQQQQQQAAPGTTTTSTTTQAPTSSTRQTTTAPPTTTTSTTTSTATPSSSSTPPPSSSTPPSSGTSTPPPSSSEPKPKPKEGSGTGISLNLGGLLEPIGGFDFFAPAG